MQLTEEEVREFAEIWKEEFGDELPIAEARARASDFAALYAILAGFPVETPKRENTTTHP